MAGSSSVLILADGRRVKLVAVRGEGQQPNMVYALLRGNEIGRMALEQNNVPPPPVGRAHYPPGSIRRVDVMDRYRRQGIATAMWRCAQDAGFEPRHGAEKTRDGKAWADTVSMRAKREKRRGVWSRMKEAWLRAGEREW